jgi:hypothetical protein
MCVTFKNFSPELKLGALVRTEQNSSARPLSNINTGEEDEGYYEQQGTNG